MIGRTMVIRGWADFSNLIFLILFASFMAGVIFHGADVLATESDPYTYANIQLEDSAPALNQILKRTLAIAANKVNAEIQASPKQDGEVVQSFLKDMYNGDASNLVRKGGSSFHRLAIGEWEDCIDSNDCDGWPKLERIVLNPGESIYAETDYNPVASKFTAAVLSVCGVRMGSDKLTHLLRDGLQKFSMWQSQGKSLDQIYAFSLRSEFEMMGALYTGVVSPADVEADLSGVRFFHDLFYGKSPYFCRDSITQKIKLQKQVNICDYISENFDERVLKNIYTGEKANELFAAIERRNEHANDAMSEGEKRNILSRSRVLSIDTGDAVNFIEKFWSIGSLVPDFLSDTSYWSSIFHFASPDFAPGRTNQESLCRTVQTGVTIQKSPSDFVLSDESKQLYQMFENHRLASQLIGPDGTLSGPAVLELRKTKVSSKRYSPKSGFEQHESREAIRVEAAD